MLTRVIAVCLVAFAALAGAGAAIAEGRLVVYSSNDANLNRFVFDAFTRETGIPVDPVEGGFLANTKVLNRSTLVFQGVGNGEFALGMSLEYAGLWWASNGAPVKVIYTQDGTVAQMEGVGIIKGGPDPDAAKAFVDYVTRKDVREAILRFAFRRAARQDLDLVNLPGQMPALKDVKLIPYDEEEWGARRAETLQKIQDLVRQTR